MRLRERVFCLGWVLGASYMKHYKKSICALPNVSTSTCTA
uniref:Uncharacterized protein n=1 Tax=Arundo donax TaxID=35708 RepID=A0A0A9A265_ARUDO